MIQVSDSHDVKRTMVLQAVLVMNMFSYLVSCTRLINASTPSNFYERTPPQEPARILAELYTQQRDYINASGLLMRTYEIAHDTLGLSSWSRVKCVYCCDGVVASQ